MHTINAFSIRLSHTNTHAQWAGFDKIVLFLIVFHTILFAVKWEGMSLATELVVQGTCNNICF